MNITVDTNVTYAVKTVVIDSIHLHLSGETMRIVAPYQWVDVDGNTLRRGTHNATEADIASMGAEATAAIPIIKSLIPPGRGGSVVLRFKKDGSVLNGFQNGRDNGGAGETYVQTKLSAEQVLNAITPLTQEQLVGMVQAMTVSVLV